MSVIYSPSLFTISSEHLKSFMMLRDIYNELQILSHLLKMHFLGVFILRRYIFILLYILKLNLKSKTCLFREENNLVKAKIRKNSWKHYYNKRCCEWRHRRKTSLIRLLLSDPFKTSYPDKMILAAASFLFIIFTDVAEWYNNYYYNSYNLFF